MNELWGLDDSDSGDNAEVSRGLDWSGWSIGSFGSSNFLKGSDDCSSVN